MKYAQIFAIGTILAMASLLFCGGCSTVGNGKLDVDAGSVIEAAAAGASGDYGPALAELGKLLKKKKEAETDIKAVMNNAGYEYSLQLFFDGQEITDHSRFTSKEGFYRVGTGKDSVLLATGGGSSAAVLGPEFDAAVEDLAEKLIKSGAVKE